MRGLHRTATLTYGSMLAKSLAASHGTCEPQTCRTHAAANLPLLRLVLHEAFAITARDIAYLSLDWGFSPTAMKYCNDFRRANYWVYSDTVGDNCVNGAMHIQIIFHKPPTPKYGCFYPDSAPDAIPCEPPEKVSYITGHYG